MRIKSQVTATPAATSEAALAHFQARLSFETDCWDVHHSIVHDLPNFVLLDVRSERLFNEGHLPMAIHLPYAQIRSETLPPLPVDGIYVVYCAGPHCNGANKAAIKVAQLGLPIKEMIGGIEGWKDEGFELENCS
ncbi:MAG: rhodanese-like domain-containing protein [Pirellulaceae bacterium]